MHDNIDEAEPFALGDGPTPEDVFAELEAAEGDEPEPAPEEKTELPEAAEEPEEGETAEAEEQNPEIRKKLEDLEKGYQKKYTALADERKSLEQDAKDARELREILKDPAKRLELANFLTGGKPGQPVQSTQSPSAVELPANWDDWAENEQTLYLARMEDRREIASLKSVLADMSAHLRTANERDQRQVMARETADALAKEWNVTVTPDQVLEAMIMTKLNDPEAAWLKANKAAIQKAAFKAEPVKTKPNTPGTRGKTFDPGDMTADQIKARMDKGEVPLLK